MKYPWWWAHEGPKNVGKRQEKGNKDIVQKVASVGNSYCNTFFQYVSNYYLHKFNWTNKVLCVQRHVIQYAINIYNNHINKSHFLMFLPRTYFRHMTFSNKIHANNCMLIWFAGQHDKKMGSYSRKQGVWSNHMKICIIYT